MKLLITTICFFMLLSVGLALFVLNVCFIEVQMFIKLLFIHLADHYGSFVRSIVEINGFVLQFEC